MSTGQEYSGWVKFFNAEQGYGYIVSEAFGEDVKLEARHIYGGVTPKKQDTVRFRVSNGQWKPRAVAVVVQGNAESEAAYEKASKAASTQARINAERRTRMANLRKSGMGGF